MINIRKIKEGDILITEESRSDQYYFVYGPVVGIERETNEVGIRTTEGNRLFPIAKLWTIPAFVNYKTGGQRESSSGHEIRVLAGFVAALLNGDINQSNNNDILEEIRKKGIPPAKTQEALEVIMNL